MDSVKTYHPEVVHDTPFPEELVDSAPPETQSVYKPEVTKDQSFPSTIVANEVVNSSLNTQTRKILGEYKFTPTGALQIGKYSPNNPTGHGDIRISPDGIVGRNKYGLETFSLDGAEGNAAFSGELFAGNIITGTVRVGSIIGGGYVMLDGEHNRMIVHDGSNYRIVIGNV